MSAGPARLQGRTIIVTRPTEESAELAAALSSLGAVARVVPAIVIEPCASTAELQAAAVRLRRHPGPRWLAVTSANAVASLSGLRLPDELEGVRVAAVGRRTARALTDLGLEVDLVSSEANAASLGRQLVKAGAGEAAVWLPQAEAARPELADQLRRAGADLEITSCYRTVAPAGLRERATLALAGGVDAIVAFSGSAIDNLVAAVGVEALRPTLLVCAGPVTADAAVRHGLRAVTAAEPADEAIVEALVGAFGPDP